MNSLPYKPVFKQEFVHILSSRKKKDIEFIKAIKEAVPKILANPYLNDTWMSYEYAGMHKKYVKGPSGYRILFAICGECRKLGHDKRLLCEDCNQKNDSVVVFFKAYKKPEGLN